MEVMNCKTCGSNQKEKPCCFRPANRAGTEHTAGRAVVLCNYYIMLLVKRKASAIHNKLHNKLHNRGIIWNK